MEVEAQTPDEYISKLDEVRQEPMRRLRESIKTHLPVGFEERMSFGMIGYVVPHSLYPAGYHCDPSLPLPFLSIASQKNFVAVYHMGIYADAKLHEWFVSEYPKHMKTKLDMGKSCIRFKKPELVPHSLIGAFCEKMSVQQWIEIYETNYK